MACACPFESSAVPLCIPNNFFWDDVECRLNRIENESRTNIELCSVGLETLKTIGDEPVCVLCIAGPARSGKSFILSQMQEDLHFDLGHTMTSHTTGIWINKNPVTVTLTDGTRAHLVLLDTEGIGAASSIDDEANAKWDNQMFTLSALLSSLLIYNTIGVPKAEDLERLYFVTNLAQSIQANSKRTHEAYQEFRECAPDFFWLLRDVLLMPTTKDGQTCGMKEYIENQVLQVSEEEEESEILCKKNEIRKHIRGMFSSFDAFSIPPPSDDPDVIQNITDPKYQDDISKHFLRKVKEVKEILFQKLRPKRMRGLSFLTGNQFILLLESYYKELNSRGSVPEWSTAWEDALRGTELKAMQKASEIYQDEMASVHETDVMPCDVDIIINHHYSAQFCAIETFKQQTRMATNPDFVAQSTKELISTFATFDPESSVCIGGHLFGILQQNEKQSEIYCDLLFEQLRQDTLEPILNDLGSEMTFEFLSEQLSFIKERYMMQARGPKVCDILERHVPWVLMRLDQAKRSLEVMQDYEETLHKELLDRITKEAELDAKNKNNKEMKILMEAKTIEYEQQIAIIEERKQKSAADRIQLRKELEKDRDRLERLMQQYQGKQKEEVRQMLKVNEERMAKVEERTEEEWQRTERKVEEEKRDIEERQRKEIEEVETSWTLERAKQDEKRNKTRQERRREESYDTERRCVMM